MKHNEDMERLEKLLAQHLQYEAVQFDFDQWAEAHAAEVRTLKSGDPAADMVRNNKQTRIWRRIMKSPYTHTAAIGIALAILLTFFFPGSNGVLPENVALADVQQAVEKQQSATTRGTRTATFETDDGRKTYVLPVLKRISNLGYSDKTFGEDGELLLQLCHHYPTATATVIFPPNKTYCRLKMGEDLRWSVWGMSPQKMFESLFQEGEYVRVGPKQIEGVKAIGFKVSDFEQRLFGGMSPDLVKFMFPIERSKCTVWVDPKTKLPILAEGEFEVGKCLVTAFRKMHLKEVNGPIQWGVEIDEKEFLPDVPEGYQQVEVPKEPLSERSIRDPSNRVLQPKRQ